MKKISYAVFDKLLEVSPEANYPVVDSSTPPSFSNYEKEYNLDSATLRHYSRESSPTFDDSDSFTEVTSLQYNMSSTVHTMDFNHNYYWSPDDSEYAQQIADRSV